MSTTELIEMINKLPADKQKEVEEFIGSLIVDSRLKTQTGYGSMKGLIKYMSDDFDAPLDEEKLTREFGSLKGFVTYMADDFDAPLEAFKDYM